MLKLALVIVVAVVGLSFLALLARKFGATKQPSDADVTASGGPPPFGKRRAILSDAEIEFYHVLAAAVQGRSTIFVQMPLNKLIDILPGTTSRQSWHNKIDRKTVDFVLCDPHSLAPQLAIELDDRTHEQDSRKKRDGFVEDALRSAGVALLRVPQKIRYDSAALEYDIRSRIRSSNGSVVSQ